MSGQRIPVEAIEGLEEVVLRWIEAKADMIHARASVWLERSEETHAAGHTELSMHFSAISIALNEVAYMLRDLEPVEMVEPWDTKED